MPPESPRKSSISSGSRSPTRPRYLGVEVAGEPSFPPSSDAWESILRALLRAAGAPEVRLRVVRSDGPRAVVEVEHRVALRARAAWGAEGAAGSVRVRTRRTWGTLRGAKAWLRRAGRDEATGRRT